MINEVSPPIQMLDDTTHHDESSRKLDLPPMIDDSETILWCITDRQVDEYCESNDKPLLSKAELERLWIFLMDEFDSYELIGEAMHHLQNGTRRFCR